MPARPTPLRLLVLSLGILGAGTVVAAEVAPLEYNRDIRPILSENCFHCHGPDANKREAKLRLDIRAEAVKQKAFIPGDAAGSE